MFEKDSAYKRNLNRLIFKYQAVAEDKLLNSGILQPYFNQ